MESIPTGSPDPTRKVLEKVAEELKKEGLLLGVNLNEDEIKEVAKKHGRMVEVVLKPEMKNYRDA